MGRVLKSVGRIVPAEILSAQSQAAAILQAAHQRAARIIGEAEAAREQARREGEAAGRGEADAGCTERLAEAAVEVERLRAAAEPIALRLAGALAARMAERIVGRAVELDPATLTEIVSRALLASRARSGIVKLRVHPDDLALLERDPARARLLARLGPGAELRLVADPAVGRHGCVVETAGGRLDARLETQLAALERVLLGEEAHG